MRTRGGGLGGGSDGWGCIFWDFLLRVGKSFPLCGFGFGLVIHTCTIKLLVCFLSSFFFFSLFISESCARLFAGRGISE